MPTNQELIDATLDQLETSVTTGITRHVTNGRDITRAGPKEQLDVLERLEARKQRNSRRFFTKLVARDVT
jgi:hypothetical protein